MRRVDQLKAAFEVIHLLPLSREDAETILAIAQLAVDIDGREEAAEIGLYFAVGRLLFELAGVPDAEIPTFASAEDDEERMFELATQLKGTPARELAFAVAWVLAEADLEIAAVETTFLDRLRGVLSISRERAQELDTVLRSA